MARELRDVLGAAPSAHDFVVSMPPHYVCTFDCTEIAEHAAIVARRGDLVAHVELWKAMPDESVAICVVADDKPGLLSMISAALVSQRLDVTRAQIYCRSRMAAALEAVDFFWVRKTTSLGALCPIASSEIAKVEETLSAALDRLATPGMQCFEPSLHFDPIPTSRVFLDAKALESGRHVLVVEARDRPGLLLAVTRALSHEGVTILESDVFTAGHLVRDRFTIIDSERRPLSELRLQSIKRHVLAATRTAPEGERETRFRSRKTDS